MRSPSPGARLVPSRTTLTLTTAPLLGTPKPDSNENLKSRGRDFHSCQNVEGETFFSCILTKPCKVRPMPRTPDRMSAISSALQHLEHAMRAMVEENSALRKQLQGIVEQAG